MVCSSDSMTPDSLLTSTIVRSSSSVIFWVSAFGSTPNNLQMRLASLLMIKMTGVRIQYLNHICIGESQFFGIDRRQ